MPSSLWAFELAFQKGVLFMGPSTVISHPYTSCESLSSYWPYFICVLAGWFSSLFSCVGFSNEFLDTSTCVPQLSTSMSLLPFFCGCSSGRDLFLDPSLSSALFSLSESFVASSLMSFCGQILCTDAFFLA